jgi:triphosphoribosyl-dephospho-CoA synthase
LSPNTGDIVGGCASLAALLEVSAYPKPGNIHRTRDFTDTKYEHFLAGSVSLSARMRNIAKKGYEISKELRDWSKLGLGEEIHGAVTDMLNWQRGGNVHLGIILLFSPLAAAAGAVMKNGQVNLDELRSSLREITRTAMPQDSLNIYKAIDAAMSTENLGTVDELDVKDTSSMDKIIDDALTPLDVFSKCRERDGICSEWVTDFNITFTEGYPFLKGRLDEGASINYAVLDTFLKLLSDHPDSLIQRKSGPEEAERIRKRARQIIQAGGVSSEKGMKMIRELDDELAQENGSLNPGTTADFTAASVFLLLLTGWRP